MNYVTTGPVLMVALQQQSASNFENPQNISCIYHDYEVGHDWVLYFASFQALLLNVGFLVFF